MIDLTRRGFLGYSGGLLAGAVGAASGLTAFSALGERRRLAETYFEAINITDGVWALLGEGGNSLVAIDGDGGLLVDTKNAPFGRVLLEDAGRLGADPSKLTVINTHHHGDHTAGNHAFKKRCKIIAHPGVADRVAGNMDWYGSMAGAGVRQLRTMPAEKKKLAEESVMAYASSVSSLKPEDWAPDQGVNDETEIGSGKFKATLRQFGPGHTDTDMVVHLTSHNIIETGDLLFHELHPYFDENGGYTCRGWLGSLWKVYGMCDADTVVVPGHGNVTDRDGVRAGIDYLEALWDEVSKAVDNGAKREDIEGKTWPFMEGKGFEQARARAIVNVYNEVTSLR